MIEWSKCKEIERILNDVLDKHNINIKDIKPNHLTTILDASYNPLLVLLKKN